MKAIIIILAIVLAVTSCTRKVYLRTYQVVITQDSCYLYEKKRLVAKYPHGTTGTDSAMLADNLIP